MKSECPEVAVLRGFAVGELAGNQFERVAAHVGNCDQCESRLAEFDDYSDELVGDLRHLPQNEFSVGEVPTEILEAALSASAGARDSTSSNVTLDPGRSFARRVQAGPVQLGRFELRSELGDGAFGYVFRARDVECRGLCGEVLWHEAHGRAGVHSGGESARGFAGDQAAAHDWATGVGVVGCG